MLVAVDKIQSPNDTAIIVHTHTGGDMEERDSEGDVAQQGASYLYSGVPIARRKVDSIRKMLWNVIYMKHHAVI
jgi:hypothetical protein